MWKCIICNIHIITVRDNSCSFLYGSLAAKLLWWCLDVAVKIKTFFSIITWNLTFPRLMFMRNEKSQYSIVIPTSVFLVLHIELKVDLQMKNNYMETDFCISLLSWKIQTITLISKVYLFLREISNIPYGPGLPRFW